jgi:transposase-like protein
MARSPDPDLRRWWRELIDSFDSERWTVAEFCQRHDVSAASFYAWRRRLGEPHASPPRAPAFLPIQITQGLADAERSVQVHLPCGVRVDVPSCDRDLLLELITHVTSEEASP